MLLNLTNKHVHAQLVDRDAGRVLAAAHTTESVSRLYKNHVIVILFALHFILFISLTPDFFLASRKIITLHIVGSPRETRR